MWTTARTEIPQKLLLFFCRNLIITHSTTRPRVHELILKLCLPGPIIVARRVCKTPLVSGTLIYASGGHCIISSIQAYKLVSTTPEEVPITTSGGDHATIGKEPFSKAVGISTTISLVCHTEKRRSILSNGSYIEYAVVWINNSPKTEVHKHGFGSYSFNAR